MLTEKSFDTGHIVINYAESDRNGPPLVILHGGTLNWQSFTDFLPTLEQRWHLYACDLPGHGKSGRATLGYGYAANLSEIAAFLERQVGEPAVLLGFSMGAAIALGMAARVPTLVRALILLEPALSYVRTAGIQSFPSIVEWCTWIQQTQRSSHSLEEVTAHYRKRAPEDTEALTEISSQGVFELDPLFLTAVLNNQVYDAYEPEKLLPQVVCPTLVIYGESSLGSAMNDEDVQLLKSKVPNATVVQIKEVGHGVIWGPSGQRALEEVTQFLDLLE